MRKVVFAHGMESSPMGTKATYLKESFDAVSPPLRHLGLHGQVREVEGLLGDDGTVLVGSSLGGLTALAVSNRCPEKVSHLVLLAVAMGPFTRDIFLEAERDRPGLFDEAVQFSAQVIPPEVPATIIHGLKDHVVDVNPVIQLCSRSESSRLLLVHDDHPLSNSRELILSVVGRAANNLDPLIS
jgi:alpha-beta hydrolase superfamily lysophospholipase